MTTAKVKTNTVISHEVLGEGASAVIVFNVVGIGALHLHLERVSKANHAKALVHGFVQKVSDAGAIPFNKKENRYPTAQEKYDALSEVIEHLHSGSDEWNRKRRVAVGTMLLDALVVLYPAQTREQLAAFLKGLSDAERLTISNEPTVKAEMDRQLAARVPTGIDAGALLAQLEGGAE